MAGKVNVLKFEKKVVNKISCDEIYDAVVVGKHEFTLRDFKLQVGHDDSLPYTAILFDNGKPLCRCLNDGWGGLTELKPTSVPNKAIMASITNAIGSYKWKVLDVEFNLRLDFIADILAEGINMRNNSTLSSRVK